MLRLQVGLSIGLLLLAGCTSWTKPGVADERQRRLDAYACARDAGLVGMAIGLSPSNERFDDCMQARGYARTSD